MTRSSTSHRRSLLLLAGAVAFAACGPATQTGTTANPQTPVGGTPEQLRTPTQAQTDMAGVARDTPEVRALDELALASQLAAYGRRTNSALALASAAEILQRHPTQQLQARTEEVAATAAARGAGVGTRADRPRREFSVQALLQEARAASPDADVVQTIQRIEQRSAEAARGTARGAVGGPRRGVYRVQAYATHRHWISFRANEPAMVYISGDGDTDLDLFVYDENGNLIGQGIGYSDTETVRFRPRWTGEFMIEVRNLGRVWNEYILVTN